LVYIIFGPTSSGKTSIATKLASELNGELISADSRQVYRYMSIGTGQIDNPLGIHLTNFIEPNDIYSVAKWQKAAYYLIENLKSRGKVPIIVGGTGLYLDSLIYDRNYGNNVHPLLPIEINLITPKITRDQIYEKINKRVEIMFEQGFVKEVENLLERGYGKCKSIKGTGYKEITEYIGNRGKTILDFPEIINSLMPVRPPILTLEECKEKVKIGYRNYAKRQLTWFRKYYTDFNIQEVSV